MRRQGIVGVGGAVTTSTAQKELSAAFSCDRLLEILQVHTHTPLLVA